MDEMELFCHGLFQTFGFRVTVQSQFGTVQGLLFNSAYYLLACFSFYWGRGGWSQSQMTLVERQVTPWTSCQFISGLTLRQPKTVTFTPMGKLKTPLTVHVFGLREEAGIPGGNPHRHGLGIEPRTVLLERRHNLF